LNQQPENLKTTLALCCSANNNFGRQNTTTKLKLVIKPNKLLKPTTKKPLLHKVPSQSLLNVCDRVERLFALLGVLVILSSLVLYFGVPDTFIGALL
jgi:hypothetical protein